MVTVYKQRKFLRPTFTSEGNTVAIEQSINKALKQVDFKIHSSGNGSGSEKGSFASSDGKCHKCDKKGHIQKDCRSKANGSNGNTSKKYTNELPEWVNRKPVVSDNKDLTTSTMTRCMVRVHEDFTGRMAMRNGKISKAKILLFVFPNLTTM